MIIIIIIIIIIMINMWMTLDARHLHNPHHDHRHHHHISDDAIKGEAEREMAQPLAENATLKSEVGHEEEDLFLPFFFRRRRNHPPPPPPSPPMIDDDDDDAWQLKRLKMELGEQARVRQQGGVSAFRHHNHKTNKVR
jgi:ABC-type nickel/cobalt efflux system permease component RcnA